MVTKVADFITFHIFDAALIHRIFDLTTNTLSCIVKVNFNEGKSMKLYHYVPKGSNVLKNGIL